MKETEEAYHKLVNSGKGKGVLARRSLAFYTCTWVPGA